MKQAKKAGAGTIFITCSHQAVRNAPADIVINPVVGPEVITGSTRMKSGTAQKMTLNLITTTAMILLGKTYGNLMIDLQVRSEKLAARSRKMLMEFLNIEYDEADELLQSSGGSVKTAIVMKKLSLNKDQAEERSKEADGFLRRVID